MQDTKKPNEPHTAPMGDFSWEQFAKDCVMNKYVLVLGSEAVIDKDHCQGMDGDSTNLLLDKTLYKLASVQDDEEELTEESIIDEYQRLKNRCKSFSTLVRKFNKAKVKSKVREVVADDAFLSSYKDHIDPNLVGLLETRCFRIVITTTIDPFVELTMKNVWGEDGFDVVDLNNVKEHFKYMNHEDFDEIRPTLCYVFGKVDPSRKSAENSFVLSENDAMEKISKWFEKSSDNRFLQYIRKFRILSVGNKFDDWMFRFFWFLLRGKLDAEADGQVAVEIKDDKELAKYMKKENVELFPDARSFMHDAKDCIIKALNISNFQRKGDTVFISYAHEDKYIAIPLFDRLCSEGIDAWIDEQGLTPGDRYEQILIKKINKCKVFMPILGSSIKRQLQTREAKKRWYYKEWSHAQSRYSDVNKINKNGKPDFTIIPFVVGDFGVDTKTCKCIDAATKFEISNDTIENLIVRIKKDCENGK